MTRESALAPKPIESQIFVVPWVIPENHLCLQRTLRLGPVNTTGVDGVADENRARTGPPRTALGPWGGEPGPHGQLLVRGVETRRRTKA